MYEKVFKWVLKNLVAEYETRKAELVHEFSFDGMTWYVSAFCAYAVPENQAYIKAKGFAPFKRFIDALGGKKVQAFDTGTIVRKRIGRKEEECTVLKFREDGEGGEVWLLKSHLAPLKGHIARYWVCEEAGKPLSESWVFTEDEYGMKSGAFVPVKQN